MVMLSENAVCKCFPIRLFWTCPGEATVFETEDGRARWCSKRRPGERARGLTRSRVWTKILSSQPPGLYRKVCYLSVAFSLGDPL
jgi:hypothetical protein